MLNALSTSFSAVRGGTTNTQAALSLTYSTVFTTALGDRPTFPNIAVLMTDGQSMVSPQNTLPEAANARQRGIELYVVAVGTDLNLAEIYGIASNATINHVIPLPGQSDIATASSSLLNRLCA